MTDTTTQVIAGATPDRAPRPSGIPKLPYLPGLDGVRAIAVVAVLLFHLPQRLLPGGFLGVDVFFVLSGFLITSLLLGEMETTERLRFGAFYARRARRLLPALLAVLAVSSVLVADRGQGRRRHLPPGRHRRPDLHDELVVHLRRTKLLRGAGSSTVAAAPVVARHRGAVLPRVAGRGLLRLEAMGASWGGRHGDHRRRAVDRPDGDSLAVQGDIPASADTARLYFGADTHAMTVLVGAALAVVWRPGSLPRHIPRSAQTCGCAWQGCGDCLRCWRSSCGRPSTSAWLFRGGFLVVAIVTALLVHGRLTSGRDVRRPARQPGDELARDSVLRHLPVALADLHGDAARSRHRLRGWSAAAVSLGLTFAAAEAQLPMVGDARSAMAPSSRWRDSAHAMERREPEPRQLRVAGFAAATVVAGGVALAAVPAVDSTTYLGGVTEAGAGELHAESGLWEPDQALSRPRRSAARRGATGGWTPCPWKSVRSPLSVTRCCSAPVPP